MKNLIYWAVATVLFFLGTLYLVSLTTSVWAWNEYKEQIEALKERDFNRQERIKEREEIRVLYEEIEVKKERIRELEKRADELNIIINGEQSFQ